MPNLDALIKELRQKRDHLDAAIDALTSISGTSRTGRTMRRTMSAAARRKIAAAQRARWGKGEGKEKEVSSEQATYPSDRS